MKEFVITVPEIHQVTYRLKAKSKADAVRKLLYEPIADDIEIIKPENSSYMMDEGNWEVRTLEEYNAFYHSQHVIMEMG